MNNDFEYYKNYTSPSKEWLENRKLRNIKVNNV